MDNALTVAREVLTRAPLFDGHNDLPWVIRIDKAARGDVLAYELNRVHEKADTDIPRLREGMVGAQFWAAFQPTSAPHPARTALEQIDLIRRIEEAHPDVFLPARKASDYAKARAAGKIASFVAVEGGVGLENALSPLRIWHAAGMRLMTSLPQRDARLGRFRRPTRRATAASTLSAARWSENSIGSASSSILRIRRMRRCVRRST